MIQTEFFFIRLGSWLYSVNIFPVFAIPGFPDDICILEVQLIIMRDYTSAKWSFLKPPKGNEERSLGVLAKVSFLSLFL